MSVLHFTPGDPTPLGYITVLLYFLAAFGCYRASRVDRSSRSIWIGLFGLMVALGINKQLDLQTTFTNLSRRLAHDEKWYDYRRTAQFYFTIAIAGVGAVIAGALLHITRSKSAPVRTAIVGTIALLAFVVIRAASFHHVDLFLRSDPLGLPWNAILEVSGISTIIAGAWTASRTGARRTPSGTR